MANSSVCSRHFKTGEIVLSAKGRRKLKPETVPSIFPWTKPSRPGVWERCPRAAATGGEDGAADDNSAASGSNTGMEMDCEPAQTPPVPMIEDHDYAESPFITVDRSKYTDMCKEIEELRQQLESQHLTLRFGLQRFASSKEDIRFYTRFPSYEHLMAFWYLIQEATTRMVRVNSAQRNLSSSTSTESPVTRPTKLLPIDELFLFLNYLSTGCTQRELGHKFNIHRATVSRIIVTWANFLYTLLGSVSIWMTTDAVKANRPVDFNGTYENTHVILDCTEMRCQTPSSLLLQSEVFSTYKSHCTFKALIGMSPHGALTFVSALFEGSISDKEIFRQCGITSLLTPEMEAMVDKGFLIDELVSGKVHRPAFLSKEEQMPEVDVLRTQSIARLRVHVERLIRRVKENKLFDTVIPLSISGSISQIFTVACLLTNYQYGPLVKKWAHAE
ncbi:uncharacterized protein LOC119790307 [Cyprinodon tularosa]|uniref:uncharacterized protein LOC119790307 n=1 Tax=Cyprinodon tularosa TaxID=77115 RepID=UPI0018E24D74|nr:uncharacterized protein LOC119790307 [Cyprinodon tularosa]